MSAVPALKPVPDNVLEFMNRASELFAQAEEESWCQRLFSDCHEQGMSESPIEQLFWIAIKTVCKVVHHEYDLNQVPDGPAGVCQGVYVAPQYQIGPYRVDFVVSYAPPLGGLRPQPVVVELDGHAFHDKDKHQRAYEKTRDRYLVGAGYRVLHFTGSEVVADPFKVANEVLALLDALHGSDADRPYRPEDPFWRGW